MVSENRRRRTAQALAASALLHLAVALTILRGVMHDSRPAAPPRPAPPVAIEVALVEAQPARPATRASAESPPLRSPPAPRRATAPRSAATSPPPRPVPSTTPTPTPTPRLPDAPAAPPSPTRPADLSFGALADAAKARVAAGTGPADDLERVVVPPPARLGARASVDELRADAERRADAVQNVRTGRAPPLLFDYLRDARDRLTPAAQRIAEALPLGPAETMRGWGRGYLGAVDQAHHGAFGPVNPGDDNPLGGPRPDVLGAYNEAERQAQSGAETRTAEVCLGVAPGRAVVVTLRRSSGNAALDRLAVDSFRAAGDERAPSPDVRPALACYRVRISAHRVPPLPSISFDFARRRLIYPLKRMTDVSVELESLDFGSKPQSSPLLHTPQ